jgi:hypothetical protein
MYGLGRRTPAQKRTEFCLDPVVGGVEDFAARHYDHINGRRRLVVTEQLTDQPLGSITFDGGAHFSRGCYSETGRTRLSFPREHGHEASGPLETCLVDKFEVGPLPDVLSGPETGHLLLV